MAADVELYLSSICRKVDKETLQGRSKQLARLRRSPTSIAVLAQFLTSIRSLGSAKTVLTIVIPFGGAIQAHCELDFSTLDALEKCIAAFVLQIPELHRLCLREGWSQDSASRIVHLTITDDHSLLVTWVDVATSRRQRWLLPLQRH